jgi:hypothetical protein
MMPDPLSHPTGTNASMDPALDRLAVLAEASGTTGRLDHLDACNTLAVGLCMRPGDVDRVGYALYELSTEIAYLRSGRQVDA